jgi:CPA2 family monovalent cation:H+ antiporter-2
LNESFHLFELVLLLALAAAGQAFFERLKLPAVVGFLVVGALAGPGVLGLIDDPEQVRSLAELGVIFLLFEIGLELPVERLRELGREALRVGGPQVLGTTSVVAWAGYEFGLDGPAALIVGVSVAMSSTALVMKLLTDDRQVDAPHGQLTLSVLLFQDLAVVPVLLAIPLLAAGQSRDGTVLLIAVARMAAALVFLLFLVRFVVPRMLTRVAREGSHDLFSLLAILLVLGSALVAEELGLTLAVGAFMAGMAASRSPFASQLFSEVVPLRGVLLGLFFTAVGMFFDPQALAGQIALVVLYVVAAVVLKVALVTGANAWFLGRPARAGLIAGLALAQTGEFSFVLAEASRRVGLLDPSTHQVILAGSIVSLVLSPFVIRGAPAIADFVFARIDGLTGKTPDAPAQRSTESSSSDRVVLIGYGPTGQTVARLLRSLSVPYSVLEGNAKVVEAASERGEDIEFGDATRPTVLDHLRIDEAKLVIVAISDALATRRIVSRLRAMTTETRILARTRYVAEIDRLHAAGANGVVAEEFEAGIEVVARTLEHFGKPLGAIQRFTEALRDEGYVTMRSEPMLPIDPWVMELLEDESPEWIEIPAGLPIGISLRSLDLRARTGCSVLVVENAGGSTRNPSPDQTLAGGDRLLALGDAGSLAGLKTLLHQVAEAAERTE